jgi:hypothetical protein
MLHKKYTVYILFFFKLNTENIFWLNEQSAVKYITVCGSKPTFDWMSSQEHQIYSWQHTSYLRMKITGLTVIIPLSINFVLVLEKHIFTFHTLSSIYSFLIQRGCIFFCLHAIRVCWRSSSVYMPLRYIEGMPFSSLRFIFQNRTKI